MEQYSKNAVSLRELSSSSLTSHVLCRRRDLCCFLRGSSLALERLLLAMLQITHFEYCNAVVVTLKSSVGDPKDTVWSQRV